MGNIECCQQKSEYDIIGYKEEIYIREKLNDFSNKMINNKKLHKIIQRCFSIQLQDIEGPPLDWISENSYNDFIYRIFDKENSQKKQSEVTYIKLEYNKVKNLSIKEYDNNFHLLLCIWLVGIAPEKTISDEEKIKIIKDTIIKSSKYITYKTFSKFLSAFLEVMLIEITYNFQKHNSYETKILLNDVYNSNHVNEYCKWLCWKMGKIITKNKKGILTDIKAINNEFIKDEHLNTFFNKYLFLIKVKTSRIKN